MANGEVGTILHSRRMKGTRLIYTVHGDGVMLHFSAYTP